MRKLKLQELNRLSVEDFKEEHGHLTPDFKKDLQVWYNRDKGKAIAEDLLQLL